MEGKLQEQVVSILIDLGSNYSFGSPKLVKKCRLDKELHKKHLLVQLEMGTRKTVNHWVKSFVFELNDMPTTTHFNVLPLGGHGILMA